MIFPPLGFCKQHCLGNLMMVLILLLPQLSSPILTSPRIFSKSLSNATKQIFHGCSSETEKGFQIFEISFYLFLHQQLKTFHLGSHRCFSVPSLIFYKLMINANTYKIFTILLHSDLYYALLTISVNPPHSTFRR